MVSAANAQFFKLLAFHTVIFEYIYSGIRNYTKLAFNSLKMIPNDTANQIGDDRPKDCRHLCSAILT